MRKVKEQPLAFPSSVNDPIDTTYPLTKDNLRVVVTVLPPQGKKPFYGITVEPYMRIENPIRIYFETLGAKEGCKVIPHLMGFILMTDIGACTIKVNLRESTMFVDFFQKPNQARDVFGNQRFDLVGTQENLFEEIKEHFNTIFALIAEKYVS